MPHTDRRPTASSICGFLQLGPAAPGAREGRRSRVHEQIQQTGAERDFRIRAPRSGLLATPAAWRRDAACASRGTAAVSKPMRAAAEGLLQGGVRRAATEMVEVW